MGQPDIKFRAWYGALQANLRSFDLISREVEQRTGVPLAWYEVLIFLAKGGSERRQMGELAQALLISRGGATRVIARMEEAGLVQREIPPENRRVTYAVLTDHGRETAERVKPVHEELVRRYFTDAIDDDEAEQLLAASVKILELTGDECAWLIEDLGTVADHG
jgi:DNA-binding MarR family transcriptional regulator